MNPLHGLTRRGEVADELARLWHDHTDAFTVEREAEGDP
jgi:hypothetical protein